MPGRSELMPASHSAARALCLEAELAELRDELVAMIALYLDAAVLHTAARAAELLQLRRERLELGARERQSADHRDALARTPRDLA